MVDYKFFHFPIIRIAGFSIFNNFHLVFKEYKEQYDKNAWNTTEIGSVINDFVDDGNAADMAFVIPYPHWVDTRLVGINAGYPGKDYALWNVEIGNSLILDETKIFIYKLEDYETQAVLLDIYPEGEQSIFYSKTPGKEFVIYTVEGHK